MEEETNFFLNDSAGKRTDSLREKKMPNVEDSERGSRLLPDSMAKLAGIMCSKYYFYKRLPVIGFMRNYRAMYLVNDLTAGVTVALTAIPQGMAYATVAGLEPQYGLYSAFMGCFAYFIFGGVKEMNIGPTAIMALMTQECIEDYNSDLAMFLCFFAGCLILLFGILHLGFLVHFISLPATVGFSTAAAITIASAQVKPLLGLTGKTHGFLKTWHYILHNYGKTKRGDFCLGALTIIFLMLIKCVNDSIKKRVKTKRIASRSGKIFAQIFNFISLGRNALAVISGAAAAYAFELYGHAPFRLTGEVQSGLPEPQLPPFSTTVTDGNGTRVVPAEEFIPDLGWRIFSIPLISILETIAIAKSFVKGRTLDATQEIIALGVANLSGSFFQSMPNAGSFTRSALNSASGVKTPLGGLFTGLLVLLALTLTATFKYIPKATLAGVIITAMIFMVDYHEIHLISRTKKLDVLPLFLTIVFCLALGLEYGILIGILISLLFVLYNTSTPIITENAIMTEEQEDILVIRPEQTLYFTGADHLRDRVLKLTQGRPRNLIVIDGTNVFSIDSTLAKDFKSLVQDFEKSEQNFVFWNWPLKSMKTCKRLDPDLEKHFQNTQTLEELLQNRKLTQNV